MSVTNVSVPSPTPPRSTQVLTNQSHHHQVQIHNYHHQQQNQQFTNNQRIHNQTNGYHQTVSSSTVTCSNRSHSQQVKSQAPQPPTSIPPTSSNITMSTPSVLNKQQECSTSTGSRPMHVNFTQEPKLNERKKKFLTAKYGQHQMSLIKKRLRVEMWMYEQLQILYDVEVSL